MWLVYLNVLWNEYWNLLQKARRVICKPCTPSNKAQTVSSSPSRLKYDRRQFTSEEHYPSPGPFHMDGHAEDYLPYGVDHISRSDDRQTNSSEDSTLIRSDTGYISSVRRKGHFIISPKTCSTYSASARSCIGSDTFGKHIECPRRWKVTALFCRIKPF